MTNPAPPPPPKEPKAAIGKQSGKSKLSSSSGKHHNSSSSSSSSRQRSLDPNFLCIPRFQNTLPSAPSGPFFVDLGLHQTFSELNKYTVSSLEKNYIWQPHLGDNAGIELDLIDQDSIVVYDASKQDLIDPIEYKFLSQVASSTRNKSLLGQNIQEDLSWLRKTTYLKRGLTFETKVQGHEKLMEKDVPNGQREDLLDPFSPDFIESSFEEVERAVLKELESRKKARKNAKITSSLPVLPNDYYCQKADDQLYSILRFDEVPTRFHPSASVHEINPDYQASARSVENQIILNSFVANIRKPRGSTRDGDFAVSVLSNISADKGGDSVPYHLVSDYKMMQTNTARFTDAFVVLVDEEEVNFYPYQTRCEMKRTTFEDSGPHVAEISKRTGERRSYVEEEEEEEEEEAAALEATERPMEVELDDDEFETTAAEE